MKFPTLLLSLFIIITSCSKDEFRSDWNDSYDQFKSFKKSNAGNYSYAVRTASWTGHGTRTVIFIQDNKVTGRAFESFQINGTTGQKEHLAGWSEDRASLNSHNEGAPTLTLDEIYLKAKDVWLKVDKDQNTIYFESNNDGMISSCGYVPNGCQDDCFTGIKIDEIKPFITVAGQLGK